MTRRGRGSSRRGGIRVVRGRFSRFGSRLERSGAGRLARLFRRLVTRSPSCRSKLSGTLRLANTYVSGRFLPDSSTRELRERFATRIDERLSVREEEMPEVEVGEAPIRGAQALPGRLRLVHEVIRDEHERPAGLPAHSPVGESERPVTADVEGGLVGADDSDLEGDDPSRQLVAEVEGLAGLAAREFVQAGT